MLGRKIMITLFVIRGNLGDNNHESDYGIANECTYLNGDSI